MGIREARSYCRICSAHCGLVLSIDDALNRILDLKADKANPMSNGYVCFKGCKPRRRIMAPRASRVRSSASPTAAMPRMSAIPVRISKLTIPAAVAA